MGGEGLTAFPVQSSSPCGGVQEDRKSKGPVGRQATQECAQREWSGAGRGGEEEVLAWKACVGVLGDAPLAGPVLEEG